MFRYIGAVGSTIRLLLKVGRVQLSFETSHEWLNSTSGCSLKDQIVEVSLFCCDVVLILPLNNLQTIYFRENIRVHFNPVVGSIS